MTTTEQEANYAITSVPLNERKGPLTMGLLWITMVTGFPTVMIGFEWFKNGLTLSQVLSCTGLSCLILLAYSIPATQLGARSGLSYTALSRVVFGRWGSRLITFNLIWLFTGCYGLIALYMADSLVGLFHWKVSVGVLAAIMAILMSVNNYFGFKGVANFARYFAAPALIGWVGYTLFKALSHCPAGVLTAVPHQSFAFALTTVSSFVIGFAVWGNELDYWRFSRPRVSASAIPLVVALIIGQIVFPAAGWLTARISGVTEYGAATALMNDYSFGGIALVAAFVLGASYFACNDSALFGCVQACENLKQINHRTWALIVATLGAICAASLSVLGVAKSMELFTSLNCIILPMPTVIMIGEWFLMVHVFHATPISKVRVPSFNELPGVRTPALISLLAGIGVGLLTAGIIPGTEQLRVGVSSLQGWLVALFVYIPLRITEQRMELGQRRQPLKGMLEQTPEADLIN